MTPIVSLHPACFGKMGALQAPSIKYSHFAGPRKHVFSVVVSTLWYSILLLSVSQGSGKLLKRDFHPPGLGLMYWGGWVSVFYYYLCHFLAHFNLCGFIVFIICFY